MENELKTERSKRMAFERAHVGSKDEIIARDEMLHWANGEVERYGILLEELKEEKEEIIDVAKTCKSNAGLQTNHRKSARREAKRRGGNESAFEFAVTTGGRVGLG